jgi:hypothetical protein
MQHVAQDVIGAAKAGGLDPTAPFKPEAPTPAAGASAAPFTGAPKFTEKQDVAIKGDQGQVEDDRPEVHSIMTGAMAAGASMPALYEMQRLTPTAITGSLAEPRQAIANFLQTFGGDFAKQFTNSVTGLDASKAGNTQELVKQAFANTVSAERASGGPGSSVRMGAMFTNFFNKAMPNINMQGPAIQEMTNYLLTQQQMARDYAQGVGNTVIPSRVAFQADPVNSRYQSLDKFTTAWTAPDAPTSPSVYEAAALAMNHRPYSEWTKGLTTRAQIDNVGQIVRNANPTQGGLLNSSNQWVPASAIPGTPR